MNAAEVGLEVARRRKEAGLTQAELARGIGTTQSAISRLEAGEALPSLAVLQRVATATGRPIEIRIEPMRRSISRREKKARVRRALGDFRFDPWQRNPSAAEARSLRSDGIKPKT